MDTSLYKSYVQIERKHITFELKENQSGMFLRITEEVGGRRNRIVIPTTGLEQFRDTVEEMIRFGTPPVERQTVRAFWPWRKAATPGSDGNAELPAGS